MNDNKWPSWPPGSVTPGPEPDRACRRRSQQPWLHFSASQTQRQTLAMCHHRAADKLKLSHLSTQEEERSSSSPSWFPRPPTASRTAWRGREKVSRSTAVLLGVGGWGQWGAAGCLTWRKLLAPGRLLVPHRDAGQLQSVHRPLRLLQHNIQRDDQRRSALVHTLVHIDDRNQHRQAKYNTHNKYTTHAEFWSGDFRGSALVQVPTNNWKQNS